MKIAIIGLGYVGLPLCLQFARYDVQVIGLDIDSAKVDSSIAGEVTSSTSIKLRREEARRGQNFSASTDFSEIRSVDAVIICVPTPLNKNREPDISYIIKTGRRSRRICKRELWSCSNQRRIRARRTRICARCWKKVQG